MRDYVFILDNEKETKKITIEASGMMDAFLKAKDFQKKKSEDKKSQVNLHFQGVIYS